MKLDNVLYTPTSSNIFTFLGLVPSGTLQDLVETLEFHHRHYFMSNYDTSDLKEIGRILKCGFEALNKLGILDEKAEYLKSYIEISKKKYYNIYV